MNLWGTRGVNDFAKSVKDYANSRHRAVRWGEAILEMGPFLSVNKTHK
jgi:hypothetical protein